MKQNKKAKICFVIHIAGFFLKKISVKQKKKKCPDNNYLPHRPLLPRRAVLPSPCPTGELALPGSGEIDHCLCPPGRGRAPGPAHTPQELSNPCLLCDHAFFAPARSNSPCDDCPTLKNTSRQLHLRAWPWRQPRRPRLLSRLPRHSLRALPRLLLRPRRQ